MSLWGKRKTTCKRSIEFLELRDQCLDMETAEVVRFIWKNQGSLSFGERKLLQPVFYRCLGCGQTSFNTIEVLDIARAYAIIKLALGTQKSHSAV